MKTQHTEPFVSLLEVMNKGDYFTKLKQDNTNNSFEVALKVSSYSELNLMVSTLLKASISVLKNEDPYLSDSMSQQEIDVVTLLDMALKLLPDDEMELLDEVHKLRLNGAY